jgi:hypothetical protein
MDGSLDALPWCDVELRDVFDNQVAEKKRIEDGAMMLQRKMNHASQLTGGLAGERTAGRRTPTTSPAQGGAW